MRGRRGLNPRPPSAISHLQPATCNLTMKRLSLLLLLLTALLAACAQGTTELAPPDIRYGEDVCVECNMIISDERFASAIGYEVAPGRYETASFDDIGDMLDYAAKHPISRRWRGTSTTTKARNGPTPPLPATSSPTGGDAHGIWYSRPSPTPTGRCDGATRWVSTFWTGPTLMAQHAAGQIGAGGMGGGHMDASK